MEKWVKERVNAYLSHGGKIHRRKQVKKLIEALQDIQRYEKGVFTPEQIGKVIWQEFSGYFFTLPRQAVVHT